MLTWRECFEFDFLFLTHLFSSFLLFYHDNFLSKDASFFLLFYHDNCLSKTTFFLMSSPKLFLYKSIMVVSVVILRMEIIIMISYLLIVTINYFHAPNKGMQGVPGISGESWSPDLKGKRKRSRRGRTLNVFYASWEMHSYHKNSTQSHFKGLKFISSPSLTCYMKKKTEFYDNIQYNTFKIRFI